MFMKLLLPLSAPLRLLWHLAFRSVESMRQLVVFLLALLRITK